MESLSISTLYEAFLQCNTVTTDTRNCPEGSLFFALKGNKFNGNSFVRQALEAGAKYAVVDEEGNLPDDSRLLKVDDSLMALQQLAHYHRKKLGTNIIGITGTNGKTTTKELLAAVLARKYNVCATPGNFNNQIGVPLTLLGLRADHEWAVIEMGASHVGDIKELAGIIDPDWGVITNVGEGHLEGFGSFEGVVRTKGELYDYMRAKAGTVFVDAFNPWLKDRLEGLLPVFYGAVDEFDKGTDSLFVAGRQTGADPFLSVEWQEKGTAEVYAVKTHLIGNYNLANVLVAVTVGRYFEVAPEAIKEALGSYVPSNNRSQFKKTDRNRLIIDAYNANPTSMKAALSNFAQWNAPHKMVILGDMKELGPQSLEVHQSILRCLSESRYDRKIFVGSEFMAASQTDFLPEGSERGTVGMEFYPDVESLLFSWHKRGLPEGYSILIKGSNSVGLIRVSEAL